MNFELIKLIKTGTAVRSRSPGLQPDLNFSMKFSLNFSPLWIEQGLTSKNVINVGEGSRGGEDLTAERRLGRHLGGGGVG